MLVWSILCSNEVKKDIDLKDKQRWNEKYSRNDNVYGNMAFMTTAVDRKWN